MFIHLKIGLFYINNMYENRRTACSMNKAEVKESKQVLELFHKNSG